MQPIYGKIVDGGFYCIACTNKVGDSIGRDLTLIRNWVHGGYSQCLLCQLLQNWCLSSVVSIHFHVFFVFSWFSRGFLEELLHIWMFSSWEMIRANLLVVAGSCWEELTSRRLDEDEDEDKAGARLVAIFLDQQTLDMADHQLMDMADV